MKLDVTVPAGLDPYVAGLFSVMEFGRPRLLRAIQGLTPAQLAAMAPGFVNSIASLALHIAANELEFAHLIMGTPVPEELKSEFLLDRPETVPVAEGETAKSLTEKLERSRAYLMERLATVSQADLDREVSVGSDQTATVRWLLALIPHHQSNHVGQILRLKKLVTEA